MIVKLTYFKRTGKYYSDGTYITHETDLNKIWKEIDDMLDKGTRPGLVDCVPGENEFRILVEVPEHETNVPRLIC